MGLFDFFRDKGAPITPSTILKKMSEGKLDYEGLKLDNGGRPVDVFTVGEMAQSYEGAPTSTGLFPVRDSVADICRQVKKRRAEAFFLSPREFTFEVETKDGKKLQITAKLDRATTSTTLPEWLLNNVKEPSLNVGPAELSALLKGRFMSTDLPGWLKVVEVSECVEPEPAAEPPVVEPEPSVEDTPPPPVIRLEDLKPGIKFGKYEIVEELGEGGMGKVFLARDDETRIDEHREVVLKVLRDQQCADEASKERLIREARTLIRLHEDCIAECYDCIMPGDFPVMVMEYVPGVSLDDYLRQHGDQLTEQDTRNLLRPIARALDYAHRQGILHLDVKPQNIMVRNHPKNGMCTCLLDFGIARMANREGQTATTTGVYGTQLYMSPQQLMPGCSPNAAMDVYSLAVTAYECLAGRVPYPRGYDGHPADPLPYGSAFAKAVMSALEYDEGRRPSTCQLLIDPVVVVPPQEKEPLSDLKRSFEVYRQLLAQSAQKEARFNNAEFAEWLRGRQTRLRELTSDLSLANSSDLVEFFSDIRARMKASGKSSRDFFAATDRLVELRSGLPEKGGKVWRALSSSVE